MKIERTLVQAAFAEDNVPQWTCPHCDRGLLNPKKEIQIQESAESLKGRGHSDWTPDWNTGVFTATLKCNNKQCADLIIVSGTTYVDYFYDNNVMQWVLTPKYFSTPIKFFKKEKHYPDNIYNIINKAFGLYWIDNASCANKLRSAVEIILDEQGVKKVNEKGNLIGLYYRVQEFKKMNYSAGHLLDATRVLGNTGSHEADFSLTDEEIITAFEFIQRVLDILYDTHSKELSAKASRIISEKKKP